MARIQKKQPLVPYVATILLITASLLCSASSLASSTKRFTSSSLTSWNPLISKLHADGYDRSLVMGYFRRLQAEYDSEPMERKVKELWKLKYGPKASANKKKSRTKIYQGFLIPKQVEAAKEFYFRNKSLLRKARKDYGVPEEITVGILTVETRLGTYLGNRNAFHTLACLAVGLSEEQIRDALCGEKISTSVMKKLTTKIEAKSNWAYAELKALLDYSQANRLNPLTLPGSLYGAIGMCQFMPSNALRYGVDGNGDGIVNLFAAEDAVFSVSNFLKNHGWKSRLSTGRKRKVLYHYNRSRAYVNTVIAVADKIRQ